MISASTCLVWSLRHSRARHSRRQRSRTRAQLQQPRLQSDLFRAATGDRPAALASSWAAGRASWGRSSFWCARTAIQDAFHPAVSYFAFHSTWRRPSRTSPCCSRPVRFASSTILTSTPLELTRSVPARPTSCRTLSLSPSHPPPAGSGCASPAHPLVPSSLPYPWIAF